MTAKAAAKKKSKKKAGAKPVDTPSPAPRPGVVKTQGQAAKVLGVDRRTLIDWMLKPGFPNSDAGFDTKAIRKWADAMGLGQAAPKRQVDPRAAEARVRREIAQAAREELALQNDLKRLLDMDDVARLLERVVATAQAVLEQLPERMVQTLPATVDEDSKHRVRNAAENVLKDAYAIIEQMLDGDADEEDEEEEKK